MIRDFGPQALNYRIHYREVALLKREAARILRENKTPGYQVGLCAKHFPKHGDRRVKLYQHKKCKRVKQHGLVNCGRYSCAYCAPIRLAKIRKRIEQTIQVWKFQYGGAFLFFSLTVPHHAGEPEAIVKKRLDETKKRFFNRMAWRRFRKRVGYRYRIVVREAMYGRNGPHPHLHVLLYVRHDDYTAKDLHRLKMAWIQAYPLDPSKPWEKPTYDNGLHISRPPPEFSIANYLTKWGLSSEVTRSCDKSPRGEGARTLWNLLEDSRKGDHQAAVLFREHFECMENQRIFSTSRNLYLDLGVEDPEEEGELRDEDAELEGWELVADITEDWELIRRHGQMWRLYALVHRFGVKGLHFFRRFMARVDWMEYEEKKWRAWSAA
jgi:hypothetical protein